MPRPCRPVSRADSEPQTRISTSSRLPGRVSRRTLAAYAGRALPGSWWTQPRSSTTSNGWSTRMGRVTSTRSKRSPGTVPYRARPRRMALRAKSTAQTRCPCSASQAAELPMPQPTSTTDAPGSIHPSWRAACTCSRGPSTSQVGCFDSSAHSRSQRRRRRTWATTRWRGVHSRDSTVDTPGTSASVSRRSSARGRSFT